jgi:hypothetical protein
MVLVVSVFFIHTATTKNKRCCSKRPLQRAPSNAAYPTIETVGFQATFSVKLSWTLKKPSPAKDLEEAENRRYIFEGIEQRFF